MAQFCETSACEMIHITVNGEECESAEGTTLAALIERLGLGQRRVAVLRNNEVVHREELASTVLTDGDTIDIVHMVGGG